MRHSIIIKRIKKEMAIQGVSILDMVEKTGLNIRTIKLFLAGERSPTINNFQKILDVLGIEIKLWKKRSNEFVRKEQNNGN